MKTEAIIDGLKRSELWAQSPCGCEFKLSDSILFDGTKPFPKEVMGTKQALIEELKNRQAELERQKKLTTEKALITSKAVNIGKNLEKILPTLKEFNWDLNDCRFIGDPLDLITFNGLAMNKVHSISFIEVKSGAARLNSHQKMIKDAIEDKKVSYKEY